MEIRVLGPMELAHDGRPLDVAGRPRDLLALLVAAHPEGVTLDTAGDAVWPDKPAAAGQNNVRVNLHKLRRLLPDPDLVVLEDGRYRLRIPDECIDVHRFRVGIDTARATADAGDPRQACAEFEAARAEWRGGPFGEFFGIGPVDAAREHLERLHLDALRDYATALLADERADEVVRALEPVVEAHLTDEALAGQLMIGLYETSQQSRALQVFGRVAETLAEVHGVSPGPELRAIADTIADGTRHERHDHAPRLHPVRHRRPVGFVGRRDELLALHQTWRRAADGEPQLALVAGEGGIGKSTLVNRFIDDVTAEGGTVLAGACEPDPIEHFQPFPQLVRDALSLAPATDTAPALLGELHQLAPDLADRLPITARATGTDGDRRRMFQAVATLLADAHTPRLLVIDDVHWIGSDAVDLFRDVLRAARGQVMVVVTFRPGQLGPDHPFERSRDHGRLSHPDLEVDLTRMTRHELVALVDAVAPTERRAEFHRAIAELDDVSAGNPLLFCEVLRQLELEPGTPIREIVPDGFRALMKRRIDQLDDRVRRALNAGAVLGRVFDLGTVATVASLPVDDALDVLDLAITAGLLVDGGGQVDAYAFAHPLIRNAVYYTQVTGRRARTHVRCAEVLLAQSADARASRRWSEIARHYLAAHPISDTDATVDAATRAGDDALARFAHAESVRWYRAALTSSGADGDSRARGLLELRLAVASQRAGDLATARTSCIAVAELARRIEDRDLFVTAVITATPSETLLDEEFGVILGGLADEALTTFAPDDPARIPLIKAATSARAYTDSRLFDRYADEAMALVDRTTDPLLVHSATVLRFLASLIFERADRLEIARGLVVYSAEHGLTPEHGEDVRRLLVQLLDAGLGDEFDVALRALDETARVTSIPNELYWTATLYATRRLMIEPSSETEQLIGAAARLGAQLQIPHADGMQMVQMYALRYQQGRSRELAVHLGDPSPDAPRVVAGTSLLALTYAESGRDQAARALLDRVVHHGRVDLPQDNFAFAGTSLFAGVAARCGSAEQRRVLRDALIPRRGRFCIFGSGGAVFGTADHWLAELAIADDDRSGAAESLDHAIRVCQSAGSKYWAARAQDRLARLG